MAATGTDPLPGWRDGAAKSAILGFVHAVTTPGDSFVAPEERVATFDADGTLWCEKPMPVEADQIIRRLAEMAESDPTLRDRQPWKAAHEKDAAWFGAVISEHYAGDDTKAKTLLGAIASAYGGMGVEAYEQQAESFLRGTQHPTLGRPYLDVAYAPMLELLAYLEANGFSTYIVSGSDGDFMRPISEELFGVPVERVIGSSSALAYDAGTVSRKAQMGFLDDGSEKPLNIWSRIGRRPLIAGGNSNGDIPMLEFATAPEGGRPALALLVLHDDADREFAYTSGAEKSLEQARSAGWTVVSMKHDFDRVFS